MIGNKCHSIFDNDDEEGNDRERKEGIEQIVPISGYEIVCLALSSTRNT